MNLSHAQLLRKNNVEIEIKHSKYLDETTILATKVSWMTIRENEPYIMLNVQWRAANNVYINMLSARENERGKEREQESKSQSTHTVNGWMRQISKKSLRIFRPYEVGNCVRRETEKNSTHNNLCIPRVVAQ